MGDAAHTAHFSIGSGTKLALEDAIGLARSIGQHPGDLTGALVARADRYGIPVPVNRTLLALLTAVSGQDLAQVR